MTAEFRVEIDKVKGSRFLGLVAPVSNEDEAKAFLLRARKEHHDARHHCSAWRLGIDGKEFRSSDDGEPSGSAGKPILSAAGRKAGGWGNWACLASTPEAQFIDCVYPRGVFRAHAGAPPAPRIKNERAMGGARVAGA